MVRALLANCILMIFLILQTGCSDVCGSDFLSRLTRGFKGESSSCSDNSVNASISVSVPTSNRTIWVDDEVAKRTLTFTYTGDSVECSRDGGSTYGNCDSNSTLVWDTSDYNQEHIIKSTGSDGESETYSFTPSNQYPGVSFVTCDSEETGSNSEFDQFTSAHLGTANKVICISDGVTISNSGAIADTEMSFGADDITIIAREGDTATFDTTQGSGTSADQSVFTISGRTGITLVGLTLTSSTGGSSWLVKVLSSSQNIQILDCNLLNSYASGAHYGVYVTGSGSTTPVIIKRSTITMEDSKVGVILSLSGYATIEDSTITSKYRGVHVAVSSTATIKNSTISCNDSGTSDYPIYVLKATVSISDSLIKDGCGNGAIIIDDSNVTTTTATIEGTTLKRTTNATGNTSAALVALNGGTGNIFNSSNNQNRICNETGSTEDFTALSSGTFSGTWNDSNQLNGGVLADCPFLAD